MKIIVDIKSFLKTTKGRIFSGNIDQIDHALAFDSRKISDGKHYLFIAIKTQVGDGHDYIQNAYVKGVRLFFVDTQISIANYPNATFILFDNTLDALNKYATWYRQTLSYPIIAITGSAGKTMVKEWLFELLKDQMVVQRSPKSYNSKLGVALSLLSFTKNADIGIVEVGISQVDEMAQMEQMVQPDYGIFTSLGSAHQENFISKKQHLAEKLKLFKNCKLTFIAPEIEVSEQQIKAVNGRIIQFYALKKEIHGLKLEDKVSLQNAGIALFVAKYFNVPQEQLIAKIPNLRPLALRMETFDGINQSLIINDTYNLDLDALTQSLEHQLMVAKDKPRIVFIGLESKDSLRKHEIEKIVDQFQPISTFYISNQEIPKVDISNAVVLLKGARNAALERLIKLMRLKKHQTYLEINLSAIKHNLEKYQAFLQPSTQVMAMVKAASYGAGEGNIATYLEQNGIHYFGVAYADEGVELRKQGIKSPILVMNAEVEGFEDCIEFDLEPAIYSLHQLDAFISELILAGKSHYPIHLKVDTGMKRLGFSQLELKAACQKINAQPEVYVKAVYSHLADSDNRRDKRFTEYQIHHFNIACQTIFEYLKAPFLKHLLNSEGVVNYAFAQMDMVRIGIGMYGISNYPQIKNTLKPVLSWHSAVSQIKSLKKGESVGYNRGYMAEENKEIAIIPVGYADGFRRSLSFGKGGVYFKNKFCPVLGKVCMDMIMVDVTGLKIQEGDAVEIIGKHQTIEQFALKMETIPYEVMTSISKRVHRVYLND